MISSGLEALAANFIVPSNVLEVGLGEAAVVIAPDVPFSFTFTGTASPHDKERLRVGKTVTIPRFLLKTKQFQTWKKEKKRDLLMGSCCQISI